MAYRQSNPFSRRTSSPFNRDKVAKPGAISKIKAISRRSSSPLNVEPTKGTFANTYEEAIALAPPTENQRVVNIGGEGNAPVWDWQNALDAAYGGLDVNQEISPAVKGAGIRASGYSRPMNVDGEAVRSTVGLKPNENDYNYPGIINHPFGSMNTGSDLTQSGTYNRGVSSDLFSSNKFRGMPVTGAGYSGDADLTADINNLGNWTGSPTFNPYTQRQVSSFTPSSFNIDSSANAGRGDWRNWSASTGYSPEGLSTPFTDKRGPEGIFAKNQRSSILDTYRPGRTGTLSLSDFRDREFSSGATRPSSRNRLGAANKIEIPNALSLYSTVDPNLIWQQGGSNPGVEYTDQFKGDYPSFIAGGLKLDQPYKDQPTSNVTPDLYNPESSIFGGEYTSSGITSNQPYKYRSKDAYDNWSTKVGGGSVTFDNPMGMSQDLYEDEIFNRQQQRTYNEAVKNYYNRGNVAGTQPPPAPAPRN